MTLFEILPTIYDGTVIKCDATYEERHQGGKHDIRKNHLHQTFQETTLEELKKAILYIIERKKPRRILVRRDVKYWDGYYSARLSFKL